MLVNGNLIYRKKYMELQNNLIILVNKDESIIVFFFLFLIHRNLNHSEIKKTSRLRSYLKSLNSQIYQKCIDIFPNVFTLISEFSLFTNAQHLLGFLLSF